MDSVLRAAITFVFLLLVFRIAGKRSLAEITTFDAVLVLIISEAIQEALIDGDHSMTNAMLLVITLVGLDVAMQWLGLRSKRVDKLLNGTPVVLLEDGHLHRDRLRDMRVSEDDILEAARTPGRTSCACRIYTSPLPSHCRPPPSSSPLRKASPARSSPPPARASSERIARWSRTMISTPPGRATRRTSRR